MSRIAPSDAVRIVTLLVLLEIVSVFYLWMGDASSLQGQRAFAVVLSLVLVTFSMISYIRRATRGERGVSRLLFLGGCILALVILFAGLIL